jgi:predicted nucleic acid-binding protein
LDAAERQIVIFCDADVLIAGAASTTGASHLLLRLSELTLVKCVTSQYAVNEAERNLEAKLPAALAHFKLIIKAALTVVPPPPSSVIRGVSNLAHAKDAPILAAAVASNADFLATFNIRHFTSRKLPPLIRRPGELVVQIRRSLAHVVN